MAARLALPHARILVDEQVLFARTLDGADLAASVPACPGWVVEDLARHLAGVYRWAAGICRLPADTPLPADGTGDAQTLLAMPRSPDVTVDYRLAAAQLRQSLQGSPRACPTLDGPGTTAWWSRRQLHETFIHRADLSAALGLPLSSKSAVALDAVAETVDTMYPRQVRLGRVAALPFTIALVSTDSPGRRRHLLGDGPMIGALSAPALTLALLLWRRTTVDDASVHITGDGDLVRQTLARPLTP